MAKGGQFERDICRQLSRWWTNNERDDCFWRTAGSGGRATVRAKQGKKTAGACGDITATDEEGIPLLDAFSFELKRGYNQHTPLNVLDALSGAADQEFAKWMQQANASCKASGALTWVIIHRRDRREAMLYMPWFAMDELRALHYEKCLPSPHLLMKLRLRRFVPCVGPAQFVKVAGVPLEAFLDWASRNLIEKYLARG